MNVFLGACTRQCLENTKPKVSMRQDIKLVLNTVELIISCNINAVELRIAKVLEITGHDC